MCNCHGGDNLNVELTGDLGANIGLDETYRDNGVGNLTGDRKKNGVFKVPSLRNVALTGPYMHDGRFKSLENVVEHYDHGVKNHENLMTGIRTFLWAGNGGSAVSGGSTGWNTSNTNSGQSLTAPRTLNITLQDKMALIAFLNTLTVVSLTKDERFANPFKN